MLRNLNNGKSCAGRIFGYTLFAAIADSSSIMQPHLIPGACRQSVWIVEARQFLRLLRQFAHDESTPADLFRPGTAKPRKYSNGHDLFSPSSRSFVCNGRLTSLVGEPGRLLFSAVCVRSNSQPKSVVGVRKACRLQNYPAKIA